MNRYDRYLVWLLACAAATVAVAWIAFGLQQEGIAPAILFPLMVGGVLGAIGVVVRRFTQVPGVRVAVAAAVVWGLLVVVGQDYIGHRRRLEVLEDQLTAQGPVGALASTQVIELRPDFFEYVVGLAEREPVWWTIDLVCTAAAAACVTAWGARRFPPALIPEP
ncbi:MAG: hypothetical protein WD845_14515 [Pirellulales bacterium]